MKSKSGRFHGWSRGLLALFLGEKKEQDHLTFQERKKCKNGKGNRQVWQKETKINIETVKQTRSKEIRKRSCMFVLLKHLPAYRWVLLRCITKKKCILINMDKLTQCNTFTMSGLDLLIYSLSDCFISWFFPFEYPIVLYICCITE